MRKRMSCRESEVGGGVVQDEKGGSVVGVVTPRWVRNKEGKGHRNGLGMVRGEGEEAESKEEEQQGIKGADVHDTDDDFEDVSASDVSGSSTPVLEPALLPPLEGVAVAEEEGKTNNPSSSSTTTEASSTVPPSSTVSTSILPSTTASSTSTVPASEPRYPLRLREITPSSSAPTSPAAAGPNSPKGKSKGTVVVL